VTKVKIEVTKIIVGHVKVSSCVPAGETPFENSFLCGCLFSDLKLERRMTIQKYPNL
jgi:hypothetical protein